jgi:predicted kinase
MEAIIFIGIQATGKSTFYKELFFTTHMRINLDMLKTRSRERLLVEACIAAKQSFVVDNTNVLKRERMYYIESAKPAGFHITGYYFQSALQDALQRNSKRTGKANIPEIGVIAKHRQLEIPDHSEGFDRLYYVSIDQTSNEFLVREQWAINTKY